MKSSSLLLLLLCSSVVFAKIHTFQNFEKNGKTILVPDVQNYINSSETIALPQNLTVSLPEGEEVILEQLQTELNQFPGITAQNAPNGFCQFTLTKEKVPPHPQGYSLCIDKQGIHIASLSKEGLYWGAQTLRNLIRNARKPELKYCHINDWPDFNRRGLFFTMRYFPKEDMAGLKRMFDACASLKINWLLMDFGECFPYSKYEFKIPSRRRAFTVKELTEIRDTCRKLHLEITPVLQVLSHAEWMSFHPDWKKMREGEPWGPWGNEACPWNEQARRITEMAIDEHIQFFKPESFLIMMDEILECTFRQCPKCKATDPKATMLNYMKFAQNAVCKHNVHPIACFDTFYSRPKWEFGDDLRKLVQHDMRFLWWAYADKWPAEREKSLDSFKGQQLVGHTLTGKPLNTFNVAHKLHTMGCKDVNLAYWYFGETGTFYKYAWENPENYGGIVNGIDYLWKLTQKPYTEFPYDGCLEMQRRLHPEDVTLPPNLPKAQPIPLENFVNADLNVSVKYPHYSKKQVAELAQSLKALPEQFRLIVSPNGHYYGLRLSGKKTQVNALLEAEVSLLDCKTQQLSLLMTTCKPENVAEYISAPNYGKKRHKQPEIAKLTILYEDGTTFEKPLRYRFEISDWNRAFGGFGLRNAVRSTDNQQRYATFGILDIVNPHPQKAMKSLKLTSLGVDGLEPVLLAVSAWNVTHSKPFKSSPFKPKSIKHPYPAKDDDRTPIIYQENFETWQGPVSIQQNIPKEFDAWKKPLGNVAIIAGGSFKDKVKAEVIPDPLDPARGKVLHIHLPKTPAIAANRWSRISVLIPYTPGQSTQCLTISHRISSKKGLSRAQDYLIGKEENTPYRFWKLPIKNEWQTIYHPLLSDFSNESTMKNLSSTCVRNISYFFQFIEEPIDIYIDNIGDSDSIYSNPLYWTPFQEYDPT